MNMGTIILGIAICVVVIAIARNFFGPRQLTMVHSYFGNIIFFNVGDINKNYWEGKINLNPPIGEVEVFITADEKGPTEEHVSFCKDIENFSSKLAETLSLKLNLASNDFWSNFKCVGFSVPALGNKDLEWDISFEDKKLLGKMYTLNFDKGEAIGLTIDG